MSGRVVVSAEDPDLDVEVLGAIGLAVAQARIYTDTKVAAEAELRQAAILDEQANRADGDNTRIPLTQRGAADGVATLDGNRHVELDQIGPEIARVADRTFAVGPDNPNLTGPGAWMQTGIGPGGTGMTLWIEDGS